MRGLFRFPASDDKEVGSASAPALPIQWSEAKMDIKNFVKGGEEGNLEEWMVHDLPKARVSVAAKTVCRVLVEETFQDGGGLH